MSQLTADDLKHCLRHTLFVSLDFKRGYGAAVQRYRSAVHPRFERVNVYHYARAKGGETEHYRIDGRETSDLAQAARWLNEPATNAAVRA